MNYKGRLSNQLGTRMGPNTLNEYMWVREQSYDKNTDTTTLEFQYFEPVDND